VIFRSSDVKRLCTPYFLFVDDGSVKVWRNYVPEGGTVSPSAQLVTAWQAVTDMLPIAKGSGLVVDWDQRSSLMYTSGDVRIVRIWDVDTELRVQVRSSLGCYHCSYD